MTSLFTSEEGKREVLRLYDQKLAELQPDVEDLTIDTHFGRTHVLVTGDLSGPPILLVHGANACAPIALETYAGLGAAFRVFAVDVPAQPNKSEGSRLNMKDASYGHWLREVIDALQLEDVTLAGFSLGGLAILKTLEYDESRIREVFLTAPAYIVNGNPLKALWKIFIPMRRFMKTQRVQFVEKFLSALFTERDAFAVAYLSKVFLHFDMDFTPVPVIDARKARQISTPITLFAAGDDLLFPGRKMLKRAKKIFPSLKHSQLLEDSKHVQSRAQNQLITRTILG